MRDLSKTVCIARWKADDGRILCEVKKGRRGATYFCFFIAQEQNFNFNMNTRTSAILTSQTIKYVPRDFRDLRLKNLQEAAQEIGELLTNGQVRQEAAEAVLDLIYAEQARRLKVSI